MFESKRKAEGGEAGRRPRVPQQHKSVEVVFPKMAGPVFSLCYLSHHLPGVVQISLHESKMAIISIPETEVTHHTLIVKSVSEQS